MSFERGAEKAIEMEPVTASSPPVVNDSRWRQLRQLDQLSYPAVALWVTVLHSLFVVTWYLQLGSRKEYLAAIRFEFLLATCLVFICFSYLPVTRPSSHQNTILRPLWLFIVCLVLGLFMSEDFGASWDIFVDRLIKFASIGVFAVAFVRGPRQLKWF